MLNLKRFIFLFLALFSALLLVGCSGNATIKSDQYEQALDFTSNEYYQIHHTEKYKSSYGVYNDDYLIKVYKDQMYVKLTDDSDSYEFYISFKDGKILSCHNYYAPDYFVLFDNDEFSEYLGSDLSAYSMSEIVQSFVWEILDEEEFTFLRENSLKDMLKKMKEHSDWDADELNEFYQEALDESYFYKKYEKMEYDEENKYYKYSDLDCDMKYYFDSKKLSKIEYNSLDGTETWSFSLTYNKEKISMPKYYNVSTMNYNNPKTYIDVELGDRRDLEEDFAIFNIDFSNGKFVLSDNDFGTINDASHLLTIDIFAKKKYAYVLFVDEKNNDIYFICYDIDN